MFPTIQNQTKLASIAFASVLAFAASVDVALAQSGHFLKSGANAPQCTDIGTQVTCTGKVAGLGGTTFEITIEASGIASVECTNPGGNVAPGQNTSITVAGTTDALPTPRNGKYIFSVTTDAPDPLPPTPTCPNDQWTAATVDVTFTTAILSLFENDVKVDEITVIVH